ncbi:MAG: DNA mismatch repair endonuclease MutL [Schleiferiaceae bacterium]|nr:DNA mismatch repair endonuclease MutL [Schleiferiaceae bacterium]
MGDLIKLLPDSVANQIAAGEVVQRPASAVKELLENAIDAGATDIQLVVRDAGKTLLQVIDNGKGMNEVDARMAFERHATSKIQSAEDLFALRTMGFRGEALASIAAVAQVELKTRMADADLGNEVRIAGSKVAYQGYCATPKGSIISVKNLFFNIPARRNFLKSDAIEFRHIIDEFEHVALAHPSIAFRLTHNDSEIFNLPSGNLKQRIVNVMGPKCREMLVQVEETTPLISITGYVLKPEAARKKRGEQFLFVNTRFVKSQYLHHAVQNAFDGLLSPELHPSYFLFLDIDPAHIDVNIHPTKTEIKFDDEKTVYAIMRSAIKHALGQYQIAPAIDFEIDQRTYIPRQESSAIAPPRIEVDPNFNPFNEGNSSTSFKSNGGTTYPKEKRNADMAAFLEFYKTQDHPEHSVAQPLPQSDLFYQNTDSENGVLQSEPFQLQETFIAAKIDGQLCLVHQQRAHERILFEHYLATFEKQSIASQQLLFPVQFEFPATDYTLLTTQFDHLRGVGFDIEPFGTHSVVIHGLPVGMEESAIKPTLDALIDAAQHEAAAFTSHPAKALAKTIAKSSAIKSHSKLTSEEMKELLAKLFQCDLPNISLHGKPIVITFQTNELEKRFQ